jgi:hypothetical protein
MNKVPDDEHFQERLYLLSHFEQYMLNKLNGMTEYNYKDEQLRTGMVFLTKYWRMKQVIAFRLCNESFQVSESSMLIICVSDILPCSSTSRITPSCCSATMRQ